MIYCCNYQHASWSCVLSIENECVKKEQRPVKSNWGFPAVYFVCLFVCMSDISEISSWISMKLSMLLASVSHYLVQPLVPIWGGGAKFYIKNLSRVTLHQSYVV